MRTAAQCGGRSRYHGNKLLSYGMLSLQNQETDRSVPDPSPFSLVGSRDEIVLTLLEHQNNRRGKGRQRTLRIMHMGTCQ